MLIIHDIESFTAPWQECALTLGVFDGMHRGHRALVDRIARRSRWTRRARILVTYFPHPDLVLGKRDAARSELYTYNEKLALYQRFDLDAVVFLPFTRDFARMTALRYLKSILLEKLKATRIVIGYDQRFGRGRKGDFDFLKKMSRRYPFKVEQIGAVKYRGEPVSTTRIRELLSRGEVERANRLLGHEFFVSAMVIRGRQRGRTIGFPTANLEVPETKQLPAEGVYACIAEYGGKRYRAMTNVGRNPTFGGGVLNVETHLLDFNDDLYGRELRLYFRERLREERKFESIDHLKDQLLMDRAATARVKL